MANEGGRRARYAPWALMSPGLLWLVLFFLVPVYYLLRTALSSVDFVGDTTFDWRWHNFSDAWTSYQDQFLRSFWYGLLATLLCIALGYPLAYVIAFRGGRWKNLLLGLVVVPFFTSYLIRTLAWKTILGDQGTLVSFLHNVGLLSTGGTLLRTPAAVGGRTCCSDSWSSRSSRTS